MEYLGLFIAGMLAFNGIPHFVHGISGQSFFMPKRRANRAQMNSPVANVIWGFTNFAVAVAILFIVFGWPMATLAKVATFMIGGLALALSLAVSMAKRAALANKPTPDQLV